MLNLVKNAANTNVVMTNADTEYSFAVPERTKKLEIKLRDIGVGWRYAYKKGVVANPAVGPYTTVPPGAQYFEENFDVDNGAPGAALTIYFASSTAGQVAEIDYWN